MSKSIISLGSGCDVATVLKNLGIRKEQYPFDWLWNLDRGLYDVASIISNDFSSIQSRDNYVYTTHHMWPKTQVLAFKAYPKIVHLHSNPYESTAELANYNLRINRFKELLKDSDIQTTFVYYRVCRVGTGEFDHTFVNTINILREETVRFAKMMEHKYPSKPFRLVSMLALPSGVLATPSLFLSRLRILQSLSDQTLAYDVVPIREDGLCQQRKTWLSAWYSALERTGVISRYDRYFAGVRKLQYLSHRKLQKLCS